MHKVFFLLFSFLVASNVDAQWSSSVGGSYTHFADYRKGKPGVLLRTAYEKSSFGITLTYHYHLPYETNSYAAIVNASNDERYVNTAFRISYQSLGLMLRKTLAGNEQKGRLYAGAGVSLLMVRYKEEVTDNIPQGYVPGRQMISDKANGLTINGLFGVEYRMGEVLPFLEAGYALSTSKINQNAMENLVPSHYGIQVGIKIPFKRNRVE